MRASAGGHSSNAQPEAARSSFWRAAADWAMMETQARRVSAIQHDQVRSGFLSRCSYVAPSPQRRSPATWPRKELTYCPIYGFKPSVICTKDLTRELFCARRSRVQTGSAVAGPARIPGQCPGIHQRRSDCRGGRRRRRGPRNAANGRAGAGSSNIEAGPLRGVSRRPMHAPSRCVGISSHPE